MEGITAYMRAEKALLSAFSALIKTLRVVTPKSFFSFLSYLTTMQNQCNKTSFQKVLLQTKTKTEKNQHVRAIFSKIRHSEDIKYATTSQNVRKSESQKVIKSAVLPTSLMSFFFNLT